MLSVCTMIISWISMFFTACDQIIHMTRDGFNSNKHYFMDKIFRIMVQLSLLCLSSLLSCTLCMDIGRNGVYDSPMATDYYVQRFGFMFGGGRSGMYGLEALQVNRIKHFTMKI